MRRPQARHPCGSSSARRPGPSVTLMLKTRCTRRPRLTDCWAAARCDSYGSAIASKWSSSVRLHLTSVAGRCRSRRRSAVAKPRCLEVPWASQAYSVVVVGFVLAADEAFLTSCRREAVAVAVPRDDATYHACYRTFSGASPLVLFAAARLLFTPPVHAFHPQPLSCSHELSERLCLGLAAFNG